MPPAVAAAGIIGAATVGSAVMGSKAAKKAANAQVDAANTAANSQERMFERQTELQEPFRQGGMAAQNRLMTLLGIAPAANDGGLNVNTSSPDFGKYARDFGMQDFEQDPGYAFRMQEGMKALNNSMAARGMGMSGAGMKGAVNYGQQAGSQEYQNAFNRYQVNRANQLNPLQSMMGAGQSSANTLTNAAGDLGRGLADTQLQAGNARASGYVGQANAISSALGQGVNAYMGYQNNQALNSFLNKGSYMTPGGGYGGGLPGASGYDWNQMGGMS